VSRRKRGRDPRPSPSTPEPQPAARPSRGTSGLPIQVAILVAVLAVVTLIAELAGAANLGVALSIGSIAFTFVLMFFVLKR
jgi:hypothetical protein